MYKYKMDENKILFHRIFSIFIILLFLSISVFSQSINGVVKDASDSEVLIGATVLVKGTTQGAITDIDGKFSIKVSKGETLAISYIGYQTLEVEYDGQPILDITLQKEFVGLDEVVIIGFGVQKKSDLSGSVTSVKAKDLEDIVATDVVSSIKGKAAGVLVSSKGGAPGEAPSLLIRGASSINASNEPLYIIDGVSGSIQNINQHDIESMEILKDAASTAIYGAAGANGVVLITTKKGKKGKAKISFSTKQGFQQKAEPIPLLSSQEEFDLLKELNYKTPAFLTNYFYDGQDASLASSRIDTVNWESVDWQDEIMQDASFQEYNLSLSGGSEKSKYMVSGLYRKNDGIIKTASANQFIFRMNLSNQLSKKFNLTTNLNISQRNQYPVADNSQGWNGALINSSMTYPRFIAKNNPLDSNLFMVNPLRPQFDNPMAWIRGKSQSKKRTSINGLIQLQYNFIQGLTFLSRNTVGYSTGTSDQWLNPYDTYVGRSANGKYTINFNESLSIGTQNTLTYLKDIGRNSITAMVGMIVGKGNSSSNSITGLDFPNDYIKEVNAATTKSGRSSHGEAFSAAYIGRLGYAFDRKYLFQFNMRADGSAFFGKNNRWAQFPSASFAWKISEEPFFNVKAINFLKFRASYGYSGNKPSSNFMYLATYGPQGADYGDGDYPINLSNALSSGYSIKRGENQDLRWETTKEINLGLDMHLFENRLIFNMDVYKRDAFDLLYILEPPVTYFDYGTGSNGGLLLNIANTSNKGIELSLTSRNIAGKFKWNTDLAFAYNENEVLSLGDNPIVNYDGRQVITPGYALNAFWGYEVDRLFQVDDFSDGERKLKEGIPNQSNVRPGDIKFKDNNGDGKIDKDDKAYLGNPTPPITYGITNTFEYGNFDLTIFLQGVQGNKIWNRAREFTEGMDNNLQQLAIVLDRWTPDNTDTDMPRAALGDPAKNLRLSDRFVEDGSYFRVKDIVFGYNFNSELLNRAKIQQSRVYLSVQNLYTITNYSGYDPEVRPVDFSGYPQNKTFVIGLNMSF